MQKEYADFILYAFAGWSFFATVIFPAALALVMTYKLRAVLGTYFVLSLCIMTAQIGWTFFALANTALESISDAACWSGLYGIIVLPSASLIDLIALGLTAYLTRLSLAIWIKLALTKLLLGFVALSAVLISAMLCTV